MLFFFIWLVVNRYCKCRSSKTCYLSIFNLVWSYENTHTVLGGCSVLKVATMNFLPDLTNCKISESNWDKSQVRNWLIRFFSFFSEIKVTFGNKTIVETMVVKTLTNQQRENRQSDNRSSRGCLEYIESTTVEDWEKTSSDETRRWSLRFHRWATSCCSAGASTLVVWPQQPTAVGLLVPAAAFVFPFSLSLKEPSIQTITGPGGIEALIAETVPTPFTQVSSRLSSPAKAFSLGSGFGSSLAKFSLF